MKITYFEDTDTALFDLGYEPPAETLELSEDLFLDLDEAGNVVSITVEHAGLRAELSEVTFMRMNAKKPLEATA